MTMQMVTDSMRKRAEQLADEAGGWLRATSRVNGRSFFIVPNSTGSAAYYCDFNHCTCRGNQYRGVCSHVEAIRLVERRRMAELAADAAWQAENDELFLGFERHEITAAPVVVAEPPVRKKMTYSELFPDNTDAF